MNLFIHDLGVGVSFLIETKARSLEESLVFRLDQGGWQFAVPLVQWRCGEFNLRFVCLTRDFILLLV